MWLMVSKRALWLLAFQTQTSAFGKPKFNRPTRNALAGGLGNGIFNEPATAWKTVP
jgi:hypothetical protein